MGSLFAKIPASALALLTISVAHLIYVLTQWHLIPLHDGIPIGQTDPDTWLRLTLIREWLTSGDWHNHLVPRANAPFEADPSPWTRPVDLVLAFFVYLQPETIDISQRIMRASLLLPWLWLTLLIAGIYHAIRNILPLNSAYIMASIMVATTPALLNYFGLGNADHHALLAVLFIWGMGGILAQKQTLNAMLISGVLFGLQLWVSVEALMLIGVVYLWFGLQWLRGDSTASTNLAWLASTAAITSLVALMIEVPPDQWLAPIYDSISIAYVYCLTLAALAAWALRFSTIDSFQGRALYGLAISSAAIISIAILYPHLPQGPLHGVDPFIITDFLPRISEAKSFLHVSPWVLVAYTFLPMALLILCLGPWMMPARAFYSREQSAKFIFFLLATLALYYSQQRWSYYLLPLSIVIGSALLGALFTPTHSLVSQRWPAKHLAGLSPNDQMKRRLPVLLLALGFPLCVMLVSTLPLLQTKTKAERTALLQRESCYNAARQLIRSGELNRVLPTPLTLWAPTDLGTEILFFTPHRIIASNYHREGAAIKYLWDTNKITTPSNLRTHLAERKVEAMLICPLVEFPKGGLIQTYAMGGRLPAWLVPVPYQLPAQHDEKKQADEDDVPLVKPILIKFKSN